MTWRSNLQSASFRGVPFQATTSVTRVGRRTEMHVYANAVSGAGKKFQDFVWAKDLGSEADAFDIEGYVIQTVANQLDYFEERDNLIKALKTQGPGTLIHPFFKEPMQVSVDGPATITEKITEEGGIARFSIKFVQYNKPIFAQLDTDFVAAVDASVLDAVNAILDNFTDLMNTAGAFLGSLAAPLQTTLTNIQQAISATKGAIASTVSTAIGIVANSLVLVQTLLNTPCDLVKMFQTTADSVLGLVGMAGEIVEGGVTGSCSSTTRGEVTNLDGTEVPEELGVSVVSNLANNGDYDSTSVESVPSEQNDNLQLSIVSIQALMLANAIRIAIRITFSSRETMEYLIEIIMTALDNLLLRIGSLGDAVDAPMLYEAVSDMRATFVDAIYKKNEDITREVSYTVPSGVQSTLELAYNKYDDIDRCMELYERNKELVNHPGFLPSGEEINILDE